ncbi:GIY-YIG nuclease family protein [Eubacteriales bacterium OttesenSCG-928-K08]|nr:GIY-YIG nuclease family protein [Eubacteriales bacterium OttesenSCG-928-K08]
MNKTVMGVYRVYCKQSGQSFVGFSRNIEGTRKRLRFELKLNACSYRPLQAFYNECKGDVEFEALEEYAPAPELLEEEVDAHLMAMLLRHKAALNAKPIQVQV